MQQEKLAHTQMGPALERLEDVEAEILCLLENNPSLNHLPSVWQLLKELKSLRRLMVAVRVDIRQYESGGDLSRKV